MTPGQKNTNAFKRHMEEMESFRRSHANLAPVERLKDFRAVQATFNNDPPCPTGYLNTLTDENSKIIAIPIWNISMPKGSQN